MKTLSTGLFLLASVMLTTTSAQYAQNSLKNPQLDQQNSLAANVKSPATTNAPAASFREEAQEELPRLLRAVFNSKWNEEAILLTVNATWKSDSLEIEYNYYKGQNVLLLDEKQLVEKIIFTVRPEDLDAAETENDEFLFLYLRNKKRISNIHNVSHRPAQHEFEDNWCSSLGLPVRTENLPMIIQYLKDLRKPE